MLDDDSYPRPGTVAALTHLFARLPRLGAVGGKVVDVDEETLEPQRDGDEVGSFDWFARYGTRSGHEAECVASFFFPEGASMIRRRAYQEVGGCFEPYLVGLTELDLATRLIAAGWDVRYLSTASFDHMRSLEWRGGSRHDIRLRVRNQLWYFWRHFPALLGLTRAAAYLTYDFIDCTYRGVLGSWTGGLLDAWRQRRMIQGTRNPVDRKTVRRIELHRGRAHVALLVHGLASLLARTLRHAFNFDVRLKTSR